MLRMIGCSHQTCGLEFREKLAIPGASLPQVLAEFRSRFPAAEAVVLSTCNRTELYTAASDPRDVVTREEAISFLAEVRGLQPKVLESTLAHRDQEQAVRHLFAVAASLDSLIVGETQILAQLRSAYEIARRMKSTGQWTNPLFQAAMRAARRVARETALQRYRVSIPSVAVRECATQVFEHLDDKRILILGAGKMAWETLRCLREEGARKITVTTRRWEQAADLAERHGIDAAPWDALPDLLATSDIVVSATSAVEPIVRLDELRCWIRPRQQRTLLILDLAVPRDFDPRVSDLPSVFLYTVDDLVELSGESLRLRQKELPEARRIVEEEAQRFLDMLTQRSNSILAHQLVEGSRQVQDLELDRLFRKDPSLDEGQRAEIRKMLDRYANKLLHPLLVAARAGDTVVPQRILTGLDQGDLDGV